ncbi:TadE/TadG family type IV pilus assembly protein [Pseudochrobactrum asaccharolyticum]|uniref:TadE/TadG family type IV pilus assembly protein n=1 Tax=Pseudochrobactrum asaccharolyticum TaxID=354351 RepID=UPI003016B9BD
MMGYFCKFSSRLSERSGVIRKTHSAVKSFARDQRGVSAVEFALLLPVMILIYAGVADVSRGVDANRKVSRVASMVGDLISRQISVMPAQLDDVFKIGATLMIPSGTAPEIRVSFIKVEAVQNRPNLVKLDWSQKTAGFKESSNRVDRENKQTYLPENLRQEPMNYIRVEAQYTYKPLLSAVLPDIAMEEIYYISPRYSDSIRYGISK